MDIDLLQPARELVFCKSRFCGFFSGRRYGKTETAKRYFLVKALSIPNWKMAYLTPTAMNGEEFVESLLDYPGLSPYVKRTKTRPSRVWLTNGSYLATASFQRSSNFRGRFFDCAWGDESNDLEGNSWWRVVRPMLADKRGTCIISGQLPSQSHWTFTDFYLPGQAKPGSELNPLDDGIPRYKSWAIKSADGPVFWTDEGKRELAISKSQMPDWMYLSEFECKPTSALNCVFAPDRLAAVTIDSTPTDFIKKHVMGNY